MNIEISDEQIEKLLEKEIGKKVNAWFQQDENKYVIRDYTHQAVKKELENFRYTDIAITAANKQINEAMVEKVCARVSWDIAKAFAERYGD